MPKNVILRNNARRAASKLLNDKKNFSIPIDVISIASALGYKVYSAKFKNNQISGGVKFLNEDAAVKGEIYVNENDSWQRQRFTIAHEIGHCVLHREKHNDGILENIDMFRNPNNHSEEEIEANEFAASILMPENEVRKQWLKWRSTEILADVFNVSLSAMSFRLFHLGYKGDW
ncbi:MAG: ImmA/IrrE family metallo-endopeptidase [Selenomonadaceae bacterium]|nr:ImmA/IrrE family metallo-endopeptidase [Selenomonadaceae bacterium]